MWELRHGRQYWFDNDDEREITEHNQLYQQLSSIDNILQSLFEPAELSMDNFMSTIEIQKYLASILRPSDVPTLKDLGKALHRLHYREGARRGVRGYYLMVRVR
jgi:hypothetical protein